MDHVKGKTIEVRDDDGRANHDAQCLLAFERSIRAHSEDKDFNDARKQLRSYLWAQVESGTGSIAEAIEELAKSGRPLRTVAAILLRSLAIDGLLPVGSSALKLDREIISLAQLGLPRLCEFVGLDQRAQTFENFPKLRNAHERVCEILVPLKADFRTLEGLIAARQPIMSALNHSCVRMYAETFQLGSIRGVIDGVIHAAQEVNHSQTTFLLDVDRCSRLIQEALHSEDENGSFIFYDFLLPLLARAEQALQSFIDSARGRFSARILAVVQNGQALPKRYPLHESGREIQVKAPLRNTGPGLATDVQAEIAITSGNLALQTPKIVVGDISPGAFSLMFDAMVIEPTTDFKVVGSVEWGEVGSDERKCEIYEFSVSAQEPNTDWPSLEYWHPYSTDTAEGERFIGRGEILNDLASRLLREPMEPFYITGQKRVGKTSLALASVAFASSQARQKEIYSTYILWGQIAYADPKTSLAELGRAIETLIATQLPPHTLRPDCLFDGSLAPLMRLAALARQTVPGKRFVVIIDEFDEIHQELYLQGSLAETFFANLRALATTRNVCLILVGGENMPFIMERQGEKLNKFTRKNLSYFSRDSEWDDFEQLVSRPSRGVVRWHDGAINAIFNETNGNPYFTNLLCSRILREAVRLRDTDVTADEVEGALATEISSLDANSFVHLWHDGIFKPLADREPDILRRRRLLVVLARCARKGLPLTTANVSENKGFSDISESEIGPTLNDFRRRNVLSEDDGVYGFTLPMFERWLCQDGLSVVQPDPVSEELASIVQAEEDAAFVRSEEVAELVRKWPTYQGRHIGSDEVHSWYQQVDSFKDQRLLFKLLQGVKFVTEAELRDRSRTAYAQLRRELSDFVMKSLTDRRMDVLITYLDGHGKSGEYFASLFAEENKIAISSICSQDNVVERLKSAGKAKKPISAVIIIDDIAATGGTLADSVAEFAMSTAPVFQETGTKLLSCVLYATRSGVDRILRRLSSLNLAHVDFRAGEVLGAGTSAFADGSKLWSSADERDHARTLVSELGARIYRSQPLGFGGLGLLIVFPTTVPNNSLPILHTASKGSAKRWVPLFVRPTN